MTFSRIWERLESSLWFRPSGWIIVLGVLAFLFMAVDRRTGGVYRQIGEVWFFSGGPEGARTILNIIGGGVLTVTSLTFSIIMVAVVQTANAYSPRVLNNYLAEPAHQHVMGILVGTFLYSVLILWEVRSVEGQVYVPSMSITVAILLSLASVGAFIFFIHYVSHSISVGNIVSLIMQETEQTLTSLFPEHIGEGWQAEEKPSLPEGDHAVLRSKQSGYITFIEGDPLMRATKKSDVVVELKRRIGDYVFAGVPLAAVWPAQAADEDYMNAVRQTFHTSKERELRHDFEHGIRQLTDIALRALSPGINDPSTAEQCVDALVNLLSKFVRHTPISPYRCDESGVVRVIAPTITLLQVLELSFSKIRNYVGNDTAMIVRLIIACGELGYATEHPIDRAALGAHVTMLAHEAGRSLEEKADRVKVNKALQQTGSLLGYDVQPLLLSLPEA